MKQLLIITALFIFSLTSFAQKDSTKKDTVRVPIILMERTDTTTIKVLAIHKNKPAISEVHVLATGYKNAENKWVQQPAVRIVNKKYQPFTDKIITVIQ